MNIPKDADRYMTTASTWTSTYHTLLHCLQGRRVLVDVPDGKGSIKTYKGRCWVSGYSADQNGQIKVTISYSQRQIVKDFLIKFTKNLQKRCQKHCMAPDTSFDRLHFSVQQVFAEIRIVWQLVDIWLPAPLDFGQFQRIGCFQCMIVARHIQNIRSNIIQTPAAKIGG